MLAHLKIRKKFKILSMSVSLPDPPRLSGCPPTDEDLEWGGAPVVLSSWMILAQKGCLAIRMSQTNFQNLGQILFSQPILTFQNTT